MKNLSRLLLVSAAVLIVLTGCPNLFGPSEEQVADLTVKVIRAPADLGADLSSAVANDLITWSSTDGSYRAVTSAISDSSTTITLTAYSPPSSDLAISGVITQSPITGATIDLTLTGALTIEKGPIDGLVLNINIAGADVSSLSGTGSVTADGEVFDVATMDVVTHFVAAIDAFEEAGP